MAIILLAEDDQPTRQFIAKALEGAGHSVIEASDGLSALEKLQAEGAAIDLLLTDIVMPGIDGLELSAKAKQLMPEIKIMYITGFSAVAHKAESQGKVLSKPFHLGDLVKQVNSTLAA